MTKLKGQLTIGRTRSSHGPDTIRVSIRDQMSIMEFASIELSLENFSKAITGLAGVDGELEIRGLDRVGKKHECKTEAVDVPYEGYSLPRGFDFGPALKAWEVDGWEADRHQMENRNNWGRVISLAEDSHRVLIKTHFHRWVEP
jgi:hypothetical protein